MMRAGQETRVIRREVIDMRLMQSLRRRLVVQKSKCERDRVMGGPILWWICDDQLKQPNSLFHANGVGDRCASHEVSEILQKIEIRFAEHFVRGVTLMADEPSYARWSLEPYSIGMKLRTLRTQKHLTLARLAV